MLSTLEAEKLTICEEKSLENPFRKVATASRTASLANEPATGWTVAGSPVMRSSPSEDALARAASSTLWLAVVAILVGSIHTLPSPRYQPTEPLLMVTSA